MPRMIYDTDANGLKLFGKCKYIGECRCGGCHLAPVNQSQETVVQKPDGSSEKIVAPAVNPAEYKSGSYGFNRDKGEAALAGRPDKPTPPRIELDPDKRRKDGIESADENPTTEPKKEVKPALMQSSTIEKPKRKTMPPMDKQNRKRCPDCNVFLRSDHKCKYGSGKNGPVLVAVAAPAAIEDDKGPITPPDLPASATELHGSSENPETTSKPPKSVELTDLQHEVTIKLAGVEITIRPVGVAV